MPPWLNKVAEEGWALLPGLDLSAIKAGQVPGWAAALREQLQPLALQWCAHIGEGDPGAGQAGVSLQTQQAGEAMPLLAHHAAGRFPLQLLILLSQPGRDFSGGHTIAVEQRPRMQSRPMVLPLDAGSIAVCACGPRQVQGRQGVYTTLLRLGAGRVLSGSREIAWLRWER